MESWGIRGGYQRNNGTSKSHFKGFEPFEMKKCLCKQFVYKGICVPGGVLTQSGHLFYNQLLSKIPIKHRTDFVPNFCPVLAVQRLRFSA
jgi:hypothetical protein